MKLNLPCAVRCCLLSEVDQERTYTSTLVFDTQISRLGLKGKKRFIPFSKGHFQTLGKGHTFCCQSQSNSRSWWLLYRRANNWAAAASTDQPLPLFSAGRHFLFFSSWALPDGVCLNSVRFTTSVFCLRLPSATITLHPLSHPQNQVLSFTLFFFFFSLFPFYSKFAFTITIIIIIAATQSKECPVQCNVCCPLFSRRLILLNRR